ncbi:hypothetical protein PZC41_14770, partial [Staphylococcus aureus]|uniref:hypothetical protein n=1 Tax=Staphylococcus aureus TaxID=1280 RepID=UPI0023B10592
METLTGVAVIVIYTMSAVVNLLAARKKPSRRPLYLWGVFISTLIAVTYVLVVAGVITVPFLVSFFIVRLLLVGAGIALILHPLVDL